MIRWSVTRGANDDVPVNPPEKSRALPMRVRLAWTWASTVGIHAARARGTPS